MDSEELQLKIDAFSPETLPMSRLADYLKAFAQMIGSEENVHFSRVEKGSASLFAQVELPAIPKIKARTQSIIDKTAPKPALKAFDVVDDLLAKDNAVAEVLLSNCKIIEFPGRRRTSAEEFGPVKRTTSIEGQIFSIGGKDETINVHLRDGERELRCVVSVDMARRLGPHVFSGKLRLMGHGNWYRVNSAWQMRTFEATDFVVLDNYPFMNTVNMVRDVFRDVRPEEFMLAMAELREE